MPKKIFVLIASMVLLLTGCTKGNPLPAGMEEDAVVRAGIQVVLQVVQGDYEGVHARMREDQRAVTAPEDFQALALRELDGAGVYKQVESSMATGQSASGEQFAVAVLYCEFSKEDVLFRVSFDQNMELIGLSIHQS